MSAGVSTRRSVTSAAQAGRRGARAPRRPWSPTWSGSARVRDPLREDVHRALGQGRLEIRPLAQRAVLPAVEGPLDVVDARRDDDPPAQPLGPSTPVNSGRPDRRSSTAAVAPGVRMFPARHLQPRAGLLGIEPAREHGLRIDAARHDGSLDLLARRERDPRDPPAADEQCARPPRRCAPRRRPRWPRPRAPRASAAGPPLANVVCPAAPPSFPAESARSTSAVPADHGPMAVNSEPRAASGPRTASDVNHSPTKSAAAIGSGPRELARGAGAQAPVGPREPQAGLPVAGRARVEPRRRDLRKLAQEPRERADVGIEPRVGAPVLGRDGGELLGRAGRIGPERERRAALAQRQHADRTGARARGRGARVRAPR